LIICCLLLFSQFTQALPRGQANLEARLLSGEAFSITAQPNAGTVADPQASPAPQKPLQPAPPPPANGPKGNADGPITSPPPSATTSKPTPSVTSSKQGGGGVAGGFVGPVGGVPPGGVPAPPQGGPNQDPQEKTSAEVTKQSSVTTSSTKSDACPKIPRPSSLPPAIQSPIPIPKAGDTIYGKGLPENQPAPPPKPPTKPASSPIPPDFTLPPLGPRPIVLPDNAPDAPSSTPPLGPGRIVLPKNAPDAPSSTSVPVWATHDVVPFGGPVGRRRILDKEVGIPTAAKRAREPDHHFNNDGGENSQDAPQEDFLVDGTVDLRAPGYQDTAATNKILLVTLAGGLVDVSTLYLSGNPPSWLKDLKGVWAGDHIYELGLFVDFLKSPQYPHVRQKIVDCGYLQRQVIAILNGVGNFASVDAGVNNLKKVYLQSNGPSASNTLPPPIYEATKNYFLAFENAYRKTYITLAYSMGNAGADQQIERDFEKYSQDRFDIALSKLKAYKAPPGGGTNGGNWGYHAFKIPQ